MEWSHGVECFLELVLWSGILECFFLESKFGVSFADFSSDNQTEHKQTDRYRENETDRQTDRQTDRDRHNNTQRCT